MRSLHVLRATVTGTVTTRDSVESSNIDADFRLHRLVFCRKQNNGRRQWKAAADQLSLQNYLNGSVIIEVDQP
jgi:hypothetical protein